MEGVATEAASSLLSSGDIAITALMFMAGVLFYLLIAEKRDHKETRGELKESGETLRDMAEKFLGTISGLKESINDFVRRQ